MYDGSVGPSCGILNIVISVFKYSINKPIYRNGLITLTVGLLRAGPMAVSLVNLLLVSACVQASVAVLDSNLNLHWELWKKTHNKNYQDEV